MTRIEQRGAVAFTGAGIAAVVSMCSRERRAGAGCPVAAARGELITLALAQRACATEPT